MSPKSKAPRSKGHRSASRSGVASKKNARAAGEGRSYSYRCRRCKLVEGNHDDMLRDCQLPPEAEVRERELWLECPKDGPELASLTDPKDPSNWRERWSFGLRGELVRLCSRYVSYGPRHDGGKQWERIGTRVSAQRAIGQWLVEQKLQTHGPSKVVSLDEIPREAVLLGPIKHLFSRTGDGRWVLHEDLGRTFGEYANKTMKWCCRNGVDLAELWRMEAVLDGSRARDKKARAERQAATLWVPFDLRFNVKAVWDRHYPIIREIQKDALRLAGRKEAHESVDRELIYRNLFCYFRRELGKESASRIAREVFPGERLRQSTKKVSTIVGQVRKALVNRSLDSSQPTTPLKGTPSSTHPRVERT